MFYIQNVGLCFYIEHYTLAKVSCVPYNTLETLRFDQDACSEEQNEQ